MCYDIHVNGCSWECLLWLLEKPVVVEGRASLLPVAVPLQEADCRRVPGVAEPGLAGFTVPGSVTAPSSLLAVCAASSPGLPVLGDLQGEVLQGECPGGCCHSTRSLAAAVLPDQLPHQLQPELEDGAQSCVEKRIHSKQPCS